MVGSVGEWVMGGYMVGSIGEQMGGRIFFYHIVLPASLFSFFPFSQQILSTSSANTLVNKNGGYPCHHGDYSVLGETDINETIMKTNEELELG